MINIFGFLFTLGVYWFQRRRWISILHAHSTNYKLHEETNQFPINAQIVMWTLCFVSWINKWIKTVQVVNLRITHYENLITMKMVHNCPLIFSVHFIVLLIQLSVDPICSKWFYWNFPRFEKTANRVDTFLGIEYFKCMISFLRSLQKSIRGNFLMIIMSRPLNCL